MRLGAESEKSILSLSVSILERRKKEAACSAVIYIPSWQIRERTNIHALITGFGDRETEKHFAILNAF